ncbi:MAG: lipoprotein [Nitrosopumilaceae archaeon]
MRRFIITLGIIIILAGCNYLAPKVEGQAETYANIVAYTEILAEHCSAPSKVKEMMPTLRIHMKAVKAHAQTSPEEIKSAAEILDKMIDELNTQLDDDIMSASYCKLKLDNIRNTSQKILDVVSTLGGFSL